MRAIVILLIVALFNIAFSIGLPNLRPGLGLGDGICRRSGCSGQICSDKMMVSTCEWRPIYACYHDATCEKQSNGSCGWTFTEAAMDCLAQNGALLKAL